jgi:hypothetical protein
MATLPAGGSAFGSISNAPGRQDEDELKNRAHTTKNVSGGVTTTTTIAATFGDKTTTVALNATVAAAKTAILTVRKADRVPSSNNANKTGRVRRVDVVQGQILTVNTLVGGTLYTTGSYTGVALTGGSGTGATADITVAGGAVTVVTIVSGGSGYDVGEVLSAAAANIGGTGSGFTVTVATTSGPNNA